MRWRGQSRWNTTVTDSNHIHRLYVTTVGDRLVFGRVYDDVDHQYGQPRDVCFHRREWDLEEDSVVRVTYERERTDIDDLPPMLVGVESIDVVERQASPDLLLDL